MHYDNWRLWISYKMLKWKMLAAIPCYMIIHCFSICVPLLVLRFFLVWFLFFLVLLFVAAHTLFLKSLFFLPLYSPLLWLFLCLSIDFFLPSSYSFCISSSAPRIRLLASFPIFILHCSALPPLSTWSGESLYSRSLHNQVPKNLFHVSATHLFNIP